jgi:glycosyltransferase involved in cell wall biosynthesis
MQGLVSILIPVFNREHLIEQTIQSALNQSYDNIEIIVVDNASTDESWSKIKKTEAIDSRIRAFRNETNIGPVRNWFRCIEEAHGLFGKILWSDDLISPDFIEKCLALFDHDTAFVYTSARVFIDDPSVGEELYMSDATGHYNSEVYIKRAILSQDVPVSPGCALFRLSDLRSKLLVNIDNKIGSDFSMHAIGNDLLLFLMTAKEYSKYGVVSEALAYFRHHEGSITVSSPSVRLAIYYAMAKSYYIENYLPSELNRMVASVWLLLKKYPEARELNVNDIRDFFQTDVELKYRYVALLLLKRITKLLKSGIQRSVSLINPF